jgi:hypothetical protein
LPLPRKKIVISHSPVSTRLRTLPEIATGRNKENITSYNACHSKFIRATTFNQILLQSFPQESFIIKIFTTHVISTVALYQGDYIRWATSELRALQAEKSSNPPFNRCGNARIKQPPLLDFNPIAKAAANSDDQSSHDSSGSISDTSFDPDRDDTTTAKLDKDDISVDSNATEKIENLCLASSNQESSIESTSGSVTTNTTLSLVDFPLFPSKKSCNHLNPQLNRPLLWTQRIPH